MKRTSLAVLFAAAGLAGCADEQVARQNGNQLVLALDGNQPVIVTRQQAFHPATDVSRRDSPGRGDLVVDFDDAPAEIKAACTNAIHQGITPMLASYGRIQRVSILFDINSKGIPVNVHYIETNQSTDMLKFDSMDDVENSQFKPPVYNGQKLYCANVRDDFLWHGDSWGLSWAERTRDGHTIARHEIK